MRTPIVMGKKKMVKMEKMENVRLPFSWANIGARKKGAVYDIRFLQRLKTKLASAPCCG
jgi:hypothetical protein